MSVFRDDDDDDDNGDDDDDDVVVALLYNAFAVHPSFAEDGCECFGL